ncbi:renal dipeptidase family [Polychytrium aggregatum]|uniref:renal dipeptidase family n=1 Tax=Polychytrium aggregatum TaxID=110093 RepID=UPI0022FE74DD|nr:renal dipeptidase family [Polychytrium aggregatum]KAI9209432.1 renal dipeptidase family [Polychytrium aggregatum]
MPSGLGSLPLFKIWTALTLLPIVLLLVFFWHGDARQPVSPLPADHLERALRLLDRVPVADGHNDFPMRVRIARNGSVNNWDMTHIPEFNTDIHRLKQGKLTVQFWSAYVSCPARCSDASHSVLQTLEQIDLIKRIATENSNTFEIAYGSADIKRIFAAKRISSLIGLEGGHSIDSSLDILRDVYALGARYMTLTHTCNTPWADSCAVAPVHGGLNEFGRIVVLEMNRLGMLVDISHVSKDTMLQVAAITKAPLFFSHSSAYAVNPHPRNVPDEVLRLLPELDGIVMVNSYPTFVTGSRVASLSDIVDHIEYIAKVAGPQYVGIGADFDGIDVVSTGFEDVSKYPHLAAELLRRDFTEDQVAGIMGGNLIRVLEKTEHVAQEQQRQGIKPFEQLIGDRSRC